MFMDVKSGNEPIRVSNDVTRSFSIYFAVIYQSILNNDGHFKWRNFISRWANFLIKSQGTRKRATVDKFYATSLENTRHKITLKLNSSTLDCDHADS
jgi:uncharacterized protein YfdQ (DUF2303 family)